MSTLKIKKIQLGSDVDPLKNFTLMQPAVADGSLVLARGNADAPGQTILTVNPQGAIMLPDGTAVGSQSMRNRIINGNFDIWQRGSSLAAGTGPRYLADRFFTHSVGTTVAVSQQAFTVGQIDVPGEPKFFHRSVVASVAGAANLALFRQSIESVRTFAGQTVTVSFYAKADAAKPIALEFAQVFGSGGSANVFGIGVQKFNLTTVWTKFTANVAIPSISGKAVGTDDALLFSLWFDAGSDSNARSGTLGQQSGTFDIAQVQIEAGNIATPFEFRDYGDELRRCQRYYEEVIINCITNVPAVAGTIGSTVSYLVEKRAGATLSRTSLADNVHFASANVQATTSYITSSSSITAYRTTAGAAGTAQFSERISVAAEL